MELALISFNKILVMFVILSVGVICYKTKLINEEGNKSLSNILLMVVNPLLMFISYQIEFEMRLFKGFLISVGFALISHIVAIIAANVIVKKSVKDFEIERMSAIYSNCGFMGIPIINALFGTEGVFYLSAYMTVFNIILWTHGVILMTGKKNMTTLLNALKAPAIIAVVLGMITFVAGIKLPQIILEPIESIAGMNTPMAMLIAGISLAQTNVIKTLKNIRVYFAAILKLLAIPILAATVISLFDVDSMVKMTAIIEIACPVASSVTLFAIRYDKNAVYASELYTVTTLLSAITIPVVIMIAEMMG